jgi:hypothetical protein
VQVERDKRRAGEVMLDGVDVIEVEDSTLDSTFGDSMMMEESERDAMTQKLQLLKRELFEIRDLLSSVH